MVPDADHQANVATTEHDNQGPTAMSVSASLRTPLFLHRQTYRRRRVMDAARLLPFLGTALLLLPMLWAETHLTSLGAVYLFLAWFALIITGALMARRLSEPLREQTPRSDEAPDK